MVRHRSGDYWTSDCRQTGCSPGGAFMTWWSFVLILVWLATFVAGQLFFKRAMESSGVTGFRNRNTIAILSAGKSPDDNFVFSKSRPAAAFRSQLPVSVSGFKHHHHHHDGSCDFEREINVATNHRHVVDHRRGRARFNELVPATIVPAWRS